MSPSTILTIFQGLDMAVKLAPTVVAEVQAVRAAVSKNPDVAETLRQITNRTIEVSDETMAALESLLQKPTEGEPPNHDEPA